MGSRLRLNPDHIYEVFVELSRDDHSQPQIVFLYPNNYEDCNMLESVPQFAFPFAHNFQSSSVEQFTFVFTDIRGDFRFGFCRHGNNSTKCLCIISYFPWFEIFYRMLNQVAELLARSNGRLLVSSMLHLLYVHEVPDQGMLCQVDIDNNGEEFLFTRPPHDELPSIPESRNMTEYYNAIDPKCMVAVFASMLCERRIIVTSRKLSRLTSCIHAAAALLYPMTWQHLYIPALPAHLLEYCSAPMPYLIGVHSSLIELAKQNDLDDALILDADANTLTTLYDDAQSLPQEVMSLFKKHLKLSSSERLLNVHLLGDGLAQAFLKVMVCLLGGYRDALRFRLGHPIEFDVESFVATHPPTMRSFLLTLLSLQAFEQFIGDRLEMLNSDRGFRGQFESEANRFMTKFDVQQRYSEWIKKKGKKLEQKSKIIWGERLLHLPNDRSTLYTVGNLQVKGRSITTMKDIKTCIKDFKSEENPLNMVDSVAVKQLALKNSTFYPQKQQLLKPSALNMASVLGPSPLPDQQTVRRGSMESVVAAPVNQGSVTFRFLKVGSAAERFHSFKQTSKSVGGEEEINSTSHQPFNVEETIEECDADDKNEFDFSTSRLFAKEDLSHFVGDVTSYHLDTRRHSLEESLDTCGSCFSVDEDSDSRSVTSRRWRLRNFGETLSRYSEISGKSTPEDSCLTSNSEENLESPACEGDTMLVSYDITEVASMDSGVQSMSVQDIALEQEASSEKISVNIPRSSSGIMRKKAFYKAPRPESISRRSSDVGSLMDGEVVSHKSEHTAASNFEDDECTVSSTTTDKCIARCSADPLSHESLSQVSNFVDDNRSSSTTVAMARPRGVYAPIGFRSSLEARSIVFSGSRNSFKSSDDT